MSRIDQNDYKVRLKTSREDEFGSLSIAFNRMAKRLQEKDLLDKYVSQSVKKLTSEPELFARAQQGSEEWVTILFADLIGFKQLQENSSDKEIQTAIEIGLSFFFEEAEKNGGEVDKVIGEKVLITFRHDILGDEKAALAAIAVARKIAGQFEEVDGLIPYFGINSGRVIAGIIGTPSVRMDYTVIGDPVNVAARLCSVASSTENTVVISGITREILSKQKLSFEKLAVKNVKGKKQEVEAFKVQV
jgi:adenylate cyclase